MPSRLLTLMRKRGFNPLSLNPTVQSYASDAYSDASKTLLVVDNDPVYVGNNAGSGGGDIAQSILANRPLYDLATKSWEFDGINDFMSFTTPIAIVLPVSCYVVVDTTNLGTSDRILLERSPAATSTPAFYLGQGSNNYKPYVYWNGNHATGSAIQGLQIVRWKLTSTNAYTKQNDNAEVDGGAHGQTLGSVNWTAINNSTSQQSDIDLRSFHLFNGIDLTADEDAQMFEYLNNRFGVY